MLSEEITRGIYEPDYQIFDYLKVVKVSQMIPWSYNGTRWLIPMEEVHALSDEIKHRAGIPITANLTNNAPEYYDLFVTDESGVIGCGFGFRYTTLDGVVRAMYKTDVALHISDSENYEDERISMDVYRQLANFDKPVPAVVSIRYDEATNRNATPSLMGVFRYLQTLRSSN